MWRVSSISTRPVTLDFTSSDQGFRKATALIFDGTVVANAIELTDWTEDRIQFEVCGACGIEHCAPGGWGVARRLDDAILFLPNFQEMAEDPKEYGPPLWMLDPGPALIPAHLLKDLHAAASELPTLERLRPLSGSEVARCLQLAAPLEVLGKLPKPPSVRRDRLCAVSEGDLSEIAAEIDRLLAKLGEQETVRLSVLDGTESAVTVWLDAPGSPEWCPLVEIGGEGLGLRWGDYRIEV